MANYPPPRPLNMPQTQAPALNRRPMPQRPQQGPQGPQGYRPPGSQVTPAGLTPTQQSVINRGREVHDGPSYNGGPAIAAPSGYGREDGNRSLSDVNTRPGAASVSGLNSGGFTSFNPSQSVVKYTAAPGAQQPGTQARPGQLGASPPIPQQSGLNSVGAAPGYAANMQSMRAAEGVVGAPAPQGQLGGQAMARSTGTINGSQYNSGQLGAPGAQSNRQSLYAAEQIGGTPSAGGQAMARSTGTINPSQYNSGSLGGAAPAPGAQANMQAQRGAEQQMQSTSPYAVPISQLGEPDPNRAMMAMRAAQGRRF